GPTTSCTSMTRRRFCAGPFRSRELRFGRLPRSCEVPPKRRCHFRTTARNSPTASRQDCCSPNDPTATTGPNDACAVGKGGLPQQGGSRLRTAVNTCRVLSERRRRFPQVLPDDEGGLRRETHRTAIGGDPSEYRQAAREQAGRGPIADAVRARSARRAVDLPADGRGGVR